MKKSILLLSLLLLATASLAPLYAQYAFFRPREGFAIEVSLPNTKLKRLPMYRNSISSLAVMGEFIVGGTSAEAGLAPFVFVASLTERKMMHIKDLGEVITGQQRIGTGYSKGKNNVLFAGTIANENKDGHLIQVKIGEGGGITVRDLGILVPGEGVFALTCDTQQNTLYGITHPTGLFFKYDIGTGKVKTYTDIVPSDEDADTLQRDYALKPEDYLSRALVRDDQGFIYGSTPVNNLFYFNPEEESFHILDDNLPEVWGRRTLGRVDAWAKSPDGKIYGGNAGDGQLFEIDPATKEIKNLGKPIMMNRIRGLTFGKDGKLYGIAGASPGYAHLFSYDPEGEGFRDLGNPEFEMRAPGIEQGIWWRGFQLGAIASSADGKYIVMGEDEALSQLLVFAIE